MPDLWLSAGAREIMAALSRAGIRSWVVGGCVRDMLRGEEPQDWDVAAAATPDEITAALCGFRLILTGLRHGTVTAVTNNQSVEVTACRGEGAYSDMRHPDCVFFSRSIEDDLARRDFTINALAFSRESGLMDLYGGVSDLELGIIRAIGEARDRFNEDALRILRALRFSAVLGFEIEEKTSAAICSLAPNLEKISAERRADEFTKLITGRNAAKILEKYPAVIPYVIPELSAQTGDGSVWRSTVKPIEYLSPDAVLRLAALLRGCTAPHGETARRAMKNLRLPNDSAARAAGIINAYHAFPEPNRRAVLYALSEFGTRQLGDAALITVAEGDPAAEQVRVLIDSIIENGDCYKITALKIRGGDLEAVGYSGREIGRTLGSLLRAVIEGECENDRDALMAYLRRMSPST